MTLESVSLLEMQEAMNRLIAANALDVFGGKDFMHAVDVAVYVMRATLAANIDDLKKSTEEEPTNETV